MEQCAFGAAVRMTAPHKLQAGKPAFHGYVGNDMETLGACEGDADAAGGIEDVVEVQIAVDREAVFHRYDRTQKKLYVIKHITEQRE